MRPEISVSLPVFNGERYIGEAIESVLGQTFSDLELIITDNASADATVEICNAYAQEDHRVRVHTSERNVGAGPNFDRGYRLSKGRYFKWMAHDDRLHPEFLSSCRSALEEHRAAVLAFTDCQIIDGVGRPLEQYAFSTRTGDPRAAVRFGDLVLKGHQCFEVFGLIRSASLRNSGLMGSHAHGDGMLLARLALQGEFHRVDRTLAEYRRHSTQSMSLFGGSGAHGRPDYKRYAEWFDTENKHRRTYPNWRILWEYLNAPNGLRLPWTERVFCLVQVARWAKRHRNFLIQDIRSA